ncbi:MAG TPA: hypothetical protein PKW95_19615 [bacterium]|nr:hypothetical protein [bacterium]
MIKNSVQKAITKTIVINKSLEQVSEAASVTPDMLTFDRSFYDEVRLRATHWKQQAGKYTKMAVLVPTGLFSLSAGFAFPDKDISLLGIGNHRFFLFHSGVAVWMMRKVYEAQLARTGNSKLLRDRVVNKIVGVAAGAAAFGVGCHLFVDIFQPKSIVFPFFGSLVTGTLVDDDLWLLANGLWCFKMGSDMMTLALGDDLPLVKAYVQRTFLEPIKEGLRDALPGGD